MKGQSMESKDMSASYNPVNIWGTERPKENKQ